MEIAAVRVSRSFLQRKAGQDFIFGCPRGCLCHLSQAATPDNMRLSNMAGGEGQAFSPICAEHRHMRASCQGAWLDGNGQWRGRPGVKLLPDFHCGKDYIKLEGGIPAEVFLT